MATTRSGGQHGRQTAAFATDCQRLENTTQTTNAPLAAGSPARCGGICPAPRPLGSVTTAKTRGCVTGASSPWDTDRGLVYAATFFDHDATVRDYHLKDGREFKVRNTAPWTWMTHEIFQIDAAGHISQVEAVLLSVPYGMRRAG